jgi:glyoxylase-like metal-dependent hydrolase (beta-lactamase superfamily II)
MITIKQFEFNPLQVNCFVLSSGNEAIIIDPSNSCESEFNQISTYLLQNNLTLKLIIVTHYHFDHVMGVADLVEKYKVPLACHKDYLFLTQYFDIATQAKSFGFNAKNPPNPSQFLNDNDTIYLNNNEIKVLYLPGHSRCSIGIYIPSLNTLLAGDVIFKDNIGRTDLPCGDYETLKSSIILKIFSLPKNTIIYPGHGESTNVDYEEKNNPYI